MRRAWLLGAGAALFGAGLTLAQEVQPSAQPAPPAPDAQPAASAASPYSDAAPPEEAAPALHAAPVSAAPVSAASGVADDEAETAPAAPPPPLKRPRYAAAILQGLDKITAETMRFEARVGEPVRYKGVVVTVHACEGAASDEASPDSWAHLEVASQTRAPPGRPAPAPRQVFRGWMSAGSPSLHPFETPGYDLWLIACRASVPETPPTGQT